MTERERALSAASTMRASRTADANAQRISSSKSATMDEGIVVGVPRDRIVRGMLGITLLLAIAHLLVSFNRYHFNIAFFGADNLYVLFDMWGEVSIPSWFSVTLLLICSGLLAIIAVGKRQAGDRFARHWFVLALIFLALSLDDVADIHGQASYRLRATLETDGVLLYAWVIPGMIFTALVGLAYLPFLAHLPNSARLRFLLAGGLFLAGALGFEMIQARYDSVHGVENIPYRLLVLVEETLEMFGTILFISTLLGYLATMSNAIRLRISHG